MLQHIFVELKFCIFVSNPLRVGDFFYFIKQMMLWVKYLITQPKVKEITGKSLTYLKDIERPKASQAIAEARDKGDLSENAEYDAAKESQGLLELKIAKMEEVLANARLIDESQLDTSKVLVLSTVKLKNVANGMQMKYTLVAESEADLKTGKISVSSPIGKGLLGKSVGEIAEIQVPNGVTKMEILEISRD